MPAFNRVKLDFDRDRGIDDPRSDPERTPTAEAIQMRFSELAGQTVKWADLVQGALRTGRARAMWLAALRREETRDDLTDEVVSHALRLVARRRAADTLGRHEYTETRDALIAEDRERNGEDGLMALVLPTANQILVCAGYSWAKALKLAGLAPYRQPSRPATRRLQSAAVPGMPVAQVIAIYAALNDAWPSSATILRFARSCGTRMAAFNGSMAPFREEAARLLQAEGVTPPTRTRGGGKGKRLTYRYPANGIPGAPVRDPESRADKLRNPRLDELAERECILSVRVWLASLAADEKRTHSTYARWSAGSGWRSATSLVRRGGFSRFKELAAAENERARRAGEDPLADALAEAERVRAEVEAIYAAGQVRQPDPVPFGEALRMVLASPQVEESPPKQ
jgi:hypothetical protein